VLPVFPVPGRFTIRAQTFTDLAGVSVRLIFGIDNIRVQASTFVDVPAGYFALPSIEALLTAGVTTGCAVNPLRYCPDLVVTRAEMAVFLLKAIEGSTFVPPVCTQAVFTDVPCASPFAPWIYELVRRGITAGCDVGLYCATAPVTREQMAVFLLKTSLGPSFVPAPCIVPVFSDVPCLSAFAPWIQELVNRGITAGCASGLYCPSDPVTRAEMAVFLVKMFNLPL
jgi:hypothetical protein